MCPGTAGNLEQRLRCALLPCKYEICSAPESKSSFSPDVKSYTTKGASHTNSLKMSKIAPKLYVELVYDTDMNFKFRLSLPPRYLIIWKSKKH